MSSEFAPLTVVSAQVTPATDAARSSGAIPLSFEILSRYTPFSRAVVAKVTLDSTARDSLGISASAAVLKLYDRRYFPDHRFRLCNVGDPSRPYSVESERAYRQFDRDYRAGSVTPTAFDRYGCVRLNKHGRIGEFEFALQQLAERVFRQEVRAYNRLHAYQGSVVPRLYGTVQYTARISLGGGAYVDEVIPGILIEHISDVTLETFARGFSSGPYAANPDVLAAICRRVMEVATHFHSIRVINDDLRLANMLIREPLLVRNATGSHSLSPRCVVMIDLELVVSREDFESEEEFQKRTHLTNMSTDIGMPLKAIVPPEVWRYEYNEWKEGPTHII